MNPSPVARASPQSSQVNREAAVRVMFHTVLHGNKSKESLARQAADRRAGLDRVLYLFSGTAAALLVPNVILPTGRDAALALASMCFACAAATAHPRYRGRTRDVVAIGHRVVSSYLVQRAIAGGRTLPREASR